jgi:hypothetical protein
LFENNIYCPFAGERSMRMLRVEFHCCSECRYCGEHGAIEVTRDSVQQPVYDLPEAIREKIERTVNELAEKGELQWCESESAKADAPWFYLFDEQGNLKKEGCMKFATFDPRPIPVAEEANNLIFAGAPQGVLGIEVTMPALAARCVQGNIDPQHSGGDINRAAIEEALVTTLPACPSEVTLATVRADLDAIGSMAILNLRAKGESLEPAMERINMVAIADKLARGGWSPNPIPTRSNPWDESSATAESSRPLAAIAAAVMDFKVALGDRVATMEKWLLTGEEPEQYRVQVEKERLDMITAMETGQIKSETRSDGRIAVVESTHRAATSVGYSLAPVVVAFNPSFKQGSGEPYKKFTICAFEAKFANIKSALAELAALEAGWGGSPTIDGSPQGVSSTLTIDQVVGVVAKHLR